MPLVRIYLCFLLVLFSLASLGREEIVHDLTAETRLLEQLASPDSDIKINAAVELGNIFRTEQGLHPEVYARILKMLSPKSPHTEREGAAWALGEMRYLDPKTRRLMKQYELEAVQSGDIALSTVLMHSLREVADVWPESKKSRCKELLKSFQKGQ